jgi:hypothetical protein
MVLSELYAAGFEVVALNCDLGPTNRAFLEKKDVRYFQYFRALKWKSGRFKFLGIT